MIDRSLTIEDPANNHGQPPDERTEGLEQRVHRLEDAVAALQDTQIMEERITDRVLGKVQNHAEPGGTGIVEADRRALPQRNPVTPAPAPAPTDNPSPFLAPRSSWVLLDTWRDIRRCVGMFFDPRFRVSWSAYIALMILAFVLFSHWLWSVIPLLGMLSVLPVVGAILDKALGLLLALYAFKCLAREIGRYNEAISGRTMGYPRY